MTTANHREELMWNQRKNKQTEARENVSDQVAIGFRLESDWLRKWPEFSGPIIKQSKIKTKQFRITFDTQYWKIS